jgi:hypothetical protein
MDRVPRKKKKPRTGWGDNESKGTGRGGQQEDRGVQGGQGTWGNSSGNHGWGGRGGGGWNDGHNQGWNQQGGGRHAPQHRPPPNNPPLNWYGRNNNNNRPVQAMPSPSTVSHYGHAGGHHSVEITQPEPLIGTLRADEAADQSDVDSDVAPVLRFGLAPTTEEWFDTKGMEWENLHHIQKIKYLIPRMKHSGRPDSPDVSFFHQLPPEILHSDFMSEKRKEKMGAAVEVALATVHQFYVDAADYAKEKDDTDEKHDYSDVSDVSDGEYENPYKRKDPGFEWGGFLSEGFATNFIKGLPKHLMFTASFDTSGSDEAHSQLCHCPCSTKKSFQWLKLIGFDGIVEEQAYKARFSACNNRKATFRHFALLAHLQALQNDPLHRGKFSVPCSNMYHTQTSLTSPQCVLIGILVYVEELYKSHYGPDFHHEALYKNVDDVKFNNVMAYKTRQLET